MVVFLKYENVYSGLEICCPKHLVVKRHKKAAVSESLATVLKVSYSMHIEFERKEIGTNAARVHS